ncbi:MAG: sodium:proton antiporter NhaD [Prevotella sp.]|nr:sodium:proton antiporter NhaD [Bacteroidales bacterium]MDD6744376.1 sodium:proton antiporter NhaD [Bacteroidales bacterium]MDY3841491.1 sodium:proton antiporter NhaD [Prevotella sp.]
MSTLTIAIVALFVFGYLLIALESFVKIDKAAIALLMFVLCWTLFMVSPESYIGGSGEDLLARVSGIIEHHLGSTSTTLFFLMGAMTIVEIVDQNGGFNWVRDVMKTRGQRKLLWRIALLTFVLSAILDNLTTSIVMVMILRKLVPDRDHRILYASMVIIAANAGGAFSPIGDVTTIMLWNKGVITALGVISEILIPSIVAMAVPALIMQHKLKGKLKVSEDFKEENSDHDTPFTRRQRQIIFFLGVGGLMFVPVFKALTGLPPFVGILLVLGVLWTVTEAFYRHLTEASERIDTSKRVGDLLSRIDMPTILFFLGILMAVACLEQIGVLTALGEGLNTVFQGNHYLVTGVIGVLSSIVDNVPLVAGCMGMYPVEAAGDMAVDGIFWQLLAYCAGVGGSMLIIGSAAGVVVMGSEKISFGWYLRHITWIAFVGYLAGIFSYWVLRSFVFTVPL